MYKDKLLVVCGIWYVEGSNGHRGWRGCTNSETSYSSPRPTVLGVPVSWWLIPFIRGRRQAKKKPRRLWRGAVWVRAATYSPGCNPSTIGAAGLNFSVRDGKRWDPCAGPPKIFARHKA